MKIIRTITENDFGRQKTPKLWSNYRIRRGARAVLIDTSYRIALMHVSNYGYYKLPGGEIDPGEEIHEGLKRELLEEVGASSITVASEVGQINEYREGTGVKSEHYAFIVKLSGEIIEPARTQKEVEHGYKTVWADNLEEAITLVESGTPTKYGQDFEKLRELTFLEEVKNLKLL